MTLFSSMLPLLHLGFTLVGLEYADKGENEIAGGNNFGPTTIAGFLLFFTKIKKKCFLFR